MLPIQDFRICYNGERYSAKCEGCGKESASKYKFAIRRMLANGSCRKCVTDYRVRVGDPEKVGKKWRSTCPSCGAEQLYTRKDHAKSSERQGWRCKPCSNSKNNTHIGSERRLYNKFRKSANNRKIDWGVSFDDFVACYTGKCALTGWDITMDYGKCTASFDRIDSSLGYTPENTQWVHTMVNMCKNKYTQGEFILMCKAVSGEAGSNGQNRRS